MSILNFQIGETGLAGVAPRIIYIETNDTLATVITAGYLNSLAKQNIPLYETDMALVSTQATIGAAPTVGWYELSFSSGNWSLITPTPTIDVVLPTIANHLAYFDDTVGTLTDAAANVINSGNIQAGLSGTAGTLASYPSASSKGSLILKAVANTADTNVTISNKLSGQATVVSIPDGGQSTTEFIIADSATTQNITSGNLQVDAGSVISGLATGGFVGKMIAYPTTTTTGSLQMSAVPNAAAYNVVISNASHSQSSTVSIPDSAQATTEFILADSATTQHITSGNLQVDAGSVISGLSTGGFVGKVIAYPTTTTTGSLQMSAVPNAAAYNVVISNESHAQSSTISIPDSAQASTKFILSDNGSTQHVTSGGFQIDNGTLSLGLASGGPLSNLILYSNVVASGSLQLIPSNSSADSAIFITNADHAQSTQYVIPDVGQINGSFLVNFLDLADPAADIVTFDVTIGFAALAVGGTVTLQASSGSKRYKIRSLYLNSGGTNFSGGGGDRLATISDGTTAYSVIPAGTLQALVNAGWGISADLPFPAAAAINTSTAAGAALRIAYSGGATDYSAGSMVISGVLERVA